MPIKFSLVIPTYNEEKNLKNLSQQLVSVLSNLNLDFEIIIVDDNSPDGTWIIAEDLAKQDRRIKLIRRRHERGLASAVVSGWGASEGEILGVIDGDMQHPFAVLAEMIKMILDDTGIDIVVASRYATGGKILKGCFWQGIRSKLATFLGKIIVSKIFKLIKDPLSGYFILRRRVIAGAKFSPIGFKILLEVLAKGRYKKVVEVPYLFGRREAGSSKSDLSQSFISLVHFIRLRLISVDK
ncbi:MAG: polyprenol monophosphomannose synthase [Candidatus Omnitrophota bacterium]